MKISRYHVPEITINSLIFIFSLIGVFATSIGTTVFMANSVILYYTIQSNLWIGLICLVFVVLRLISNTNNKVIIFSWLYVIKYVFTVAIALTMIVFWLLIAPTLGMPSYLLSLSNLFSHTMTPILALLSFFIFDAKQNLLSKKTSLYSLATPIYYFVFFLIVSSFGIKFGFFRSPYFFLDFYEFGWFGFSVFSDAYGFASFGVFYWLIIILVAVLLLGFALVLLNRILKKKARR